MNLLNGSEALSGDKIMSVISELQPVLPSLKHLKVVSACRRRHELIIYYITECPSPMTSSYRGQTLSYDRRKHSILLLERDR